MQSFTPALLQQSQKLSCLLQGNYQGLINIIKETRDESSTLLKKSGIVTVRNFCNCCSHFRYSNIRWETFKLATLPICKRLMQVETNDIWEGFSVCMRLQFVMLKVLFRNWEMLLRSIKRDILNRLVMKIVFLLENEKRFRFPKEDA